MPLFLKNHNDDIDHFKALFDYATMGILVTDKNGQIVDINPFALKIFGYSGDELNGKRIEVLIPSRFYEKHIQHHKQYFDKPESRPLGTGKCLWGLRKDGTEFPVELSLSHYNKEGEKFVIAFISDVSERQKTQAEITELNNELEAKIEIRTKKLQKALDQLEEVNDRLEEAISFQRAILNNAGAMIIVTDEKGIIKFFNPEASHNIGYAESELINKETPLIFHLKNEIAKKRREISSTFGIAFSNDFDAMVEKSKRNNHKEEPYTYVRKDGTTFPVLLTITCMRDFEGEITGYMGVAVDISERKKAEEDLRESLRKERELGELKSRFVSMASHEFRTPLSTVLSSAYLIEKYTSSEDQPKRQKHLQRILSSVNMLTDILNDFLSVGRIEEGKIHVRPAHFNIKELVLTLTGEIMNTLKKQQKILYHHEGNPMVLLDPSLLKHIVMNLISNASKFSNENSPIEIKTINNNSHLVLSIKDYGMGISNEDQEHLMERFFRGANATNIQGTGLGLHIVSRYTELMDGTIKCISELEKGTEFIITFNTKEFLS